MLAAVGQLETCRDARRQFSQAVIQKRCARLKAPGHGHVIDAFHRVIHQHDCTVETQRLVDARIRAGLGKMLAHKVAGSIVGGQPLWLHGGLVLGIAAIKKGLAVGRVRIAGAVYLRVPVVTGKQFISALAALHHLAMFGDFARQQVKGDAVVTDHRLAHGPEGRRQLLDDFVFANA